MLLREKIKSTGLLLFLFIPFFSVASEKVLLDISSASQGFSEQYTLAQLLQLPQHEIQANIPWTNQTHVYSGPYLEDVLDITKANGEWLTLYALDRYQISFNFNRIKKYKPILALSVDGTLLTIRTKGPIWVILPVDDYKELTAAVYHDFMVWQLVKINIEEAKNDNAL